jgi:O-antigen/teichoic acid export membrane protein
MTQIGRKIVSGVVWTGVEILGRDGVNLLVFVILATLLGPEAFGLLALAMAVPVILAIPVQEGLPDAIVQRREIEEDDLNSVFWFLMVLGAALTVAVWLSAGTIATVLGAPEIEPVIQWMSLVIVIRAFGAVPGAILNRQLLFKLFAIRTMIGIVVGGVVGIGMALAGYGVWSLVAMSLVRPLLENLFVFTVADWRPKLRFSFARCRSFFPFAAPLALQSFVNIVNDQMPKVILGTFVSPAAGGIYVLALKPLTLLSRVLTGPILRVTMPAVARLDGNPVRIGQFFDTSVRLTLLFAVPAFAGFGAITPIIVPALFAEEWLPTIAAIQILMLLSVVYCVEGVSVRTILAMGHSGLILALHVAYLVVGAILITIGAQFGIRETVWAIVVSNYLLLPVFLYKVRQLVGIDVMQPLRILPAVGLATALMLVAVEATSRLLADQVPPVPLLVACILAGAVTYGLAALVLLRDDLRKARGLLARLRAPRTQLEPGE